MGDSERRAAWPLKRIDHRSASVVPPRRPLDAQRRAVCPRHSHAHLHAMANPTLVLVALLLLITLLTNFLPSSQEHLRASNPFQVLNNLGIVTQIPEVDRGLVAKLPPWPAPSRHPDTTAVILNWSRFPNVILIVSLLCSNSLSGIIAAIHIWNNQPNLVLTHNVLVLLLFSRSEPPTPSVNLFFPGIISGFLPIDQARHPQFPCQYIFSSSFSRVCIC